MTVAIGGVPAHELEVGELVARVHLDHGLPATGEPEEVEMAQPEVLASLFSPLFVAILGQQLTAVERQRLAGGDDVLVGESAASNLLEANDVDPDVSIGTQHDGLAPQDDRAGHIECPPGVVRGLVQLRHRLVDRVVRPDEIDDLLSVQTPPRRRAREL